MQNKGTKMANYEKRWELDEAIILRLATDWPPGRIRNLRSFKSGPIVGNSHTVSKSVPRNHSLRGLGHHPHKAPPTRTSAPKPLHAHEISSKKSLSTAQKIEKKGKSSGGANSNWHLRASMSCRHGGWGRKKDRRQEHNERKIVCLRNCSRSELIFKTNFLRFIRL